VPPVYEICATRRPRARRAGLWPSSYFQHWVQAPLASFPSFASLEFQIPSLLGFSVTWLLTRP
jgi:hypothetical protein